MSQYYLVQWQLLKFKQHPQKKGRQNLAWEESVKRDLKDWNITKELAMDRGAPEP